MEELYLSQLKYYNILSSPSNCMDGNVEGSIMIVHLYYSNNLSSYSGAIHLIGFPEEFSQAGNLTGQVVILICPTCI